MTRADYVMVGGFLGAGKTTALLRLAAHLTAQGRRVGLITNDQSYGLVDTALVESHGYPVQEITGGCFCCRFNSLTAAAERLTAESTPDVFLAEPVGSCTDLRASVQYPLRRLYGDDYRIAPLSVLVDPIRALRILGVEPGKAFSSKVLYVYAKQLEEAELIVVNKTDLLDAGRRDGLETAVRQAYPSADVLFVSAREGTGLERWFARITGAEADRRPAPPIDYDTYADGEALLGWFNATVELDAPAPFDGNALLLDLARRVRADLNAAGMEIAHLKMTLAPSEDGADLGALNLVAGDRAPELSHLLQEGVAGCELIVNLRAEGEPAVLRDTVAAALAGVAAAAGARAHVVHSEHFRPARPNPTHRFATT
jgi:Ni2+-binding GTPase involved in maturation of urease and hydrogenase